MTVNGLYPWLGGQFPMAQITPFTYREGATLLHIMREFEQWLRKIGVEIDGKLTAYLEEMLKIQGGWKELFDKFMADVDAELQALNDQAVANLVNNAQSKIRIALDKTYANKTTQTTVETGRLSSESLNTTFANKATQDTVETGRLSTAKVKETILTNAVGRGETFINIEDYGAKADGTSATQAIQDAVNAAKGRTVVIPPKAYYVPNVVELPRDFDVTVSMYGATLYKDGSASQNSYAFFSALSRGRKGYGSGGRNIIFSGGKFKGDFGKDQTPCAFALHHVSGFTARDIVFEEMQGSGHIADFAGCENILFDNCDFVGALDNASRAEAIQLDTSTAGSLSVLDDAGSHDGLATRNVTVQNSRFLPLVKGGTLYPAPVTIGSHSEWEGAWFQNIKFLDNYVYYARMTGGKAPTGALHFSMVDGLTVRGNTFKAKPGPTPDGRVIGVYAAETMVPLGSDPNVPQTGMPVPEADRHVCKDIEVSGNTFIGFNNRLTNSDVVYMNGVAMVECENNKFEECASMIDIRNGYYVTLNKNKFRKPVASIADNLLNFNKVRWFEGSGNIIDARNTTGANELVGISNESFWGYFERNVVHGMGTDGIKQSENSTWGIADNNTTL